MGRDLLLSQIDGHPVSDPVAEWTVRVLPLRLPPAPLPLPLLLCELGRTPRGRQTVSEHREALAALFDEPTQEDDVRDDLRLAARRAGLSGDDLPVVVGEQAFLPAGTLLRLLDERSGS